MSCTKCCVPLYDRTLELVRAAPRSISYAEMARQIGVTRAWMSKFANGGCESASVKTVQKLHDYLASMSE